MLAGPGFLRGRRSAEDNLWDEKSRILACVRITMQFPHI